MIHDNSVIVESRRMSLEEYGKEIDVKLMARHMREFIDKCEKASVIVNFDSLANYKAAYFEMGHPVYRPDFGNASMINLSRILTDYDITDSQLIAVKLWRVKDVYTVEVLKFPLENYGKTWRCWTAVPTDKQIRKVKWL